MGGIGFMAKASAKEEIISLLPDDETIPRPRLSKLIIKNFRTIGNTPVEIYLDDIVVLVGANNVGKSSILRAYEVAMNTGSKAGYLTIDDFPNNIVDSENLPEIEVYTIISENKPGAQWIKTLPNGEMLIREKWTWSSPGVEPKRRGFDVDANAWVDKVPWGAPNVANAYRPKVHRIDAFASPETQEAEITGLLHAIIKDKFKNITSPGNTSGKTDYEILLEQIKGFQKTVAKAVDEETENIEKSINKYLEGVFHNYVISLDAKPESNVEKTYTPFKETPDLFMGPDGGFMSRISAQGSGARRTLMWTALKYIAENGDNDGRPHVLLLDEPELCLHPSAIRDARKTLYDLPQVGNWQVMVTTHSPIFIDLSRDNTTIIRVSRDETDEVKSTVLFRPENAKLSDDDKDNMKLLNVCDPYVHEFFFGGRIVVVEGDTEYTAFSRLKLLYPGEYDDVHIIRARGKGVIPSIIKILNQFTSNYGILHDADTKLTPKGTGNPAWTVNTKILSEVNNSSDISNTVLIACKTNFEDALLNVTVSKDKPYHTLEKMKTDISFREKVKSLLDALLDNKIDPPEHCIRWQTLDDIE